MSEIRTAVADFYRLIYSNLSLLKLRLSPSSIVMKVNARLKLPAMTSREIGIYKKCLLSQPPGEPLNIFEYGSGFSTIYFAKFLKKKEVAFHIYSVDNNPEWYGKIEQLIRKEGLNDVVTLYLHKFTPFWEKEEWDRTVSPRCGQFAPKLEAEFEYINAPVTVGKKFSFISIDARFRRRCLEIVTECLTEKGTVFLHDAQKRWYHEPLSLYKCSKFIDGGRYYPFEKRNWKIWIGSLNNSGLSKI